MEKEKLYLSLKKLGNNKKEKPKEYFACLRYTYDSHLQNFYHPITSYAYPVRGVRHRVWPTDLKGILVTEMPSGTDFQIHAAPC